MKRVYLDRLLRLARLLERDARNEKGVQFDMHSWGRTLDPAKPVSCGTKACAMGLAVISKEFEEEGLTRDQLYHHEIRFVWKGTRTDGFCAGKQLFGLTSLQSELFFSPSQRGSNEGAKAELSLARRIRRFVTANS